MIESAQTKVVHEPKSFDVWLLGITIVISGQYFSWNAGLEAGFGSFFIAFCIMGVAYLSLVFVLAELVSLLPFRGGAFVITRSLLGFYSGFIVGSLEVLQYILYVSSSALFLADILGHLFNTNDYMQPVYCSLFYVSAIALYLQGKNYFWSVKSVLGILSIIVLIIYCLGSLKFSDFESNAAFKKSSSKENGKWFRGGILKFINVFPLSAWFFAGVESLSFSCEWVNDAAVSVPRGMLLSISTLIMTGIFVLFVVCSLPPGIEAVASFSYPLSVGLELSLHSTRTVALGLMIPAVYGTAYGFILGYTKILQYMSASHLLPSVLSLTNSKESPYVSLILGSILGQIICVAAYFRPTIRDHLFNICILSGFITYIAQCACHFTVKTRLPNEVSGFPNPMGMYGALFAMAVFSFGIICVIGFQHDNGAAVATVIIFTLIVSFYYWLYGSRRQIISDEESKYTFTYLVMKRNARIHAEVHRKRSSQGSSKFDSRGKMLSSVLSSVHSAISRKSDSYSSSVRSSIRRSSKDDIYLAETIRQSLNFISRKVPVTPQIQNQIAAVQNNEYAV